MPKNLRQRLVGGVASVSLGLAGLLGVGMMSGGCETPGGAMFMSVLGAASMAKGGTPKQMALASASRALGDVSLARLNAQGQAEATERAGQNIAEALRSSQGYVGQQAAIAQPEPLVNENNSFTFLWRDYNNNFVVESGEVNRQDTFKLSDLSNRANHYLGFQAEFNRSFDGKTITRKVQDASGKIIETVNEAITTIDDSGVRQPYCESITVINPGLLKNTGIKSSGNKEVFLCIYESEGKEV